MCVAEDFVTVHDYLTLLKLSKQLLKLKSATPNESGLSANEETSCMEGTS
jgi:hypothetical protein